MVYSTGELDSVPLTMVGQRVRVPAKIWWAYQRGEVSILEEGRDVLLVHSGFRTFCYVEELPHGQG